MSGQQFSVFDRDFAPVCQNATVAVPFETSVAAPLACTDANGHPITYSIVQAPTNGVLAAINQSAQTVAYDPFSGFSGTDSFTYRGSAFGVDSAAATVTLNVAPEGQPIDPSLVDSDGDGYPKASDCNDSNAAIHPNAVDIAGNGVDEDCSGADTAGSAPTRFRVLGDGTAGTVRVNKRRVFKLRGHRVDCTGPGPACAVTTKATAKVDFAAPSAVRKRRIGGSKFTVASGKTKAIKVKMTKKAFKALKRRGKMKAKVVVKVKRGTQGSKKTVKVRLKPPR